MPRRALSATLLLLGVVALVAAALASAPPGVFEDEREMLTAASHLARSGTLAFERIEADAPRPDAFREPGYPLLVAAAWRIAGAAPPRAVEELAAADRDPRLWGAVRGVNVLLLALAAAACGLAARRLAGPVAGGLAFALIAASPALRAIALDAMSENAAAALCAGIGASWALWAAAPSPRTGVPALLVTAIAPLVRAETVVLLPVAGLLFWRVAGRDGRALRRAARPLATALVALGLLLPSLLWAARTRSATGHWALSDRGGLALAVRAELDGELARHGAATLMLAWTPLEAAREAALARAPGLTLLDQRPSGPGNFFTRTLRRWRAERSAPGADPLAVDARFRAEGIDGFGRRPLAHLAAVPAVVWRGLFAERSPGWARPVDLELALGLLLAAGAVLYLVRAALRRDPARLALAAPLLALGGFHALCTELLPRYAVPLLPIAWTLLAIEAVSVLAPRRPGVGAGEGQEGAR